MTSQARTPELPENVHRMLEQFLKACENAYGDGLLSAVLYGSAAEGTLRPASDVNLLLVLKEFPREATDAIREPLRLAEAAIRLQVMFVLKSELSEAATAFAQKFADIKRRYAVLRGEDVIARLVLSREAEITRLKQVLMNLQLRMRGIYVLRSQREEQMVRLMADFAGPLRTCAATLLELEGTPAESPKAALLRFAQNSRCAEEYGQALAAMSAARENRPLPAGSAAAYFYSLVSLTADLRRHAGQLR